MALSDQVKKSHPPVVHGTPCSIGEVYRSIESDQAETKALDRLLYEMNLTAAQVWEALNAEGYTVGRQSVNKHRGRKCRCFKDAA